MSVRERLLMPVFYAFSFVGHYMDYGDLRKARLYANNDLDELLVLTEISKDPDVRVVEV